MRKMHARDAIHDYNICYILIYFVRVRVFLLFLDGIGNDVYSTYKINKLHTNPRPRVHIQPHTTHIHTNTLGLHSEFTGDYTIYNMQNIQYVTSSVSIKS